MPTSLASGGKSSASVTSPNAPPAPPPPHPARRAISSTRAKRRTPVWCQWMRRVTYSRNVTLSLSRTCRCHCKYCSFATHKPHLHEPEEVERLIDRAARRGIKELLVLTGEAPAVQPRLDKLGFTDFTDYVVGACERALER